MYRNNYNTKQKEIITAIIKKQNKEFTINDIYKELKGQVGLTTIYREVNSLINEGFLSKSITNRNKTSYQYLEKCHETNHFYLKCISCGNLIHIDCDCISKLANHIFLKHQFKLTKERIIINGKCPKCM